MQNALDVVVDVLKSQPRIGNVLRVFLSKSTFNGKPDPLCIHCSGTGDFFQLPCSCRLVLTLDK